MNDDATNPSDTPTRKCPRDGHTLAPQIYEADIEVDVCGLCKGVWLDEGELKEILDTVERDYSKQLAQGPDHVQAAYAGAQQSAHGTIRCPLCSEEMIAREYMYCSQVIVDVCPQGCGVWLDAGELQRLEVFFEQSHQATRQMAAARADETKGFWGSLLAMFKTEAK